MQASPYGAVEREPSRDRGRCVAAVAGRAGALRVTGRAQGRIGCGASAVAANEVRVVNEVILGPGALVLQINMARVAIAGAPLIFVGVAAEAGGHRGPEQMPLLKDVQ